MYTSARYTLLVKFGEKGPWWARHGDCTRSPRKCWGGMLLNGGGRFDARVGRRRAPLLHDTERDQPGRHPDLVPSAGGYGRVPDRDGRCADLPDAQAHLLKGRMMDVVSVLSRKPAMYIGGSWVRADETRLVINPADESAIAAVPE